jgi:hypothetical protein
MFKKNKYTILKDLYIGKAIETDAFWGEKFLDREGYELNSIEKELYSANEIPVIVKNRQTRRVPDNALKVQLQEWYSEIKPHPNILIDHAHILHRLAYKDEALDQLKEKAKQYPHLWRMVHLKPKYGADFAIDWVEETQAIEIFHFELDARDYNEFLLNLEKLEDFIDNTDWESKAHELVNKKNSWIHLNEYEQAVYKAKFYDFNKIGIKYFEDDYLNKPYLFSYLKVID